MRELPIWTLLCKSADSIGPWGWSMEMMVEERVVLRDVVMKEAVREKAGGTFTPDIDKEQLKFLLARRMPPNASVVESFGWRIDGGGL